MVSFGSHTDFSVPHIQIRALNKTYASQGQHVHALKDIDLDIPEGKILGIIGKSGAGKSSLIRTLNGLEHPSSGSIKIYQNELTTLDHDHLIKLRQRIGMIFQHFNLMSAKTVWENVALPLKVSGYDKAEIKNRVDEVLSLVGLAHKADQYPAQLSGGQKQRVGIARALVHHPEILLCDEATSALDPESTSVILNLLKQINQELGITIVLITHEMQVIREICDQVVVIDHGEIVESGQVWSVFSNPVQPITQELLSLEQLELPFDLHREINANSTHSILRIKYQSEAHRSPDLNNILSSFDTPVYLYQSHIDTIQQHLIGNLIIGIPKLDLNINTLQQKLLPFIHHIEVIGYARPTH
ncbi:MULTISPECIES: methionine ABC transporter ATP-binding protein [Acinetobacter]|uniref:Methionine import ATP-binding protein MetN 1 n=1 Tax=Acinetobacter baylyi (strain ATCC 33305 / BD413 / ADP1) TaxID=62977 RepID=METN1_ACIAD|nr:MULTISPECIES: ATP-binding cassette domain-containing protein [Acinetobacter]Q6FAN3.1 RecName: Full=Methionine import ATP-binding protein MetN 1 [Acinetobacter baylyi ADP1]ENV53816.1 methionine import ATP-binding protein MetN 1 [Acinetobacter baylyi DSM 14961 = CIP 107474]KAF2373211.1 methionine ABC transporter ATP-binding protein [Acinetobacter baylyi]KAF2374372.1 methionine ABC transporter ATP-binding protein [Acinetobacter baylyi]KAF2376194.1 methionine ABC transporter ATP-binding protein